MANAGSKPRSKPRKPRAKQNQAITNLEPMRTGWSGLAAVIIERATLEELALSEPPKEAKKIRASEEAIRLEKRKRQLKRQLWKDICSMAAERVLDAPGDKGRWQLAASEAEGNRRAAPPLHVHSGHLGTSPGSFIGFTRIEAGKENCISARKSRLTTMQP
jgi:hypothetical protein